MTLRVVDGALVSLVFAAGRSRARASLNKMWRERETASSVTHPSLSPWGRVGEKPGNAPEDECPSYVAFLRSKRVTRTKERLLRSLWFSTSLRGRRRLGFWLVFFLEHARGTRQGEGGSAFHPACARASSVEISPFFLNNRCLVVTIPEKSSLIRRLHNLCVSGHVVTEMHWSRRPGKTPYTRRSPRVRGRRRMTPHT